MTSRWIAIFLSLFLAVPLCCCGWHAAQVASEEPVCPACAAAGDTQSSSAPQCPCGSDLVQRDLAPKTIAAKAPTFSFANLQETLIGLSFATAWRREIALSSTPVPPRRGPPRLYLRHRSLLC